MVMSADDRWNFIMLSLALGVLPVASHAACGSRKDISAQLCGQRGDPWAHCPRREVEKSRRFFVVFFFRRSEEKKS